MVGAQRVRVCHRRQRAHPRRPGHRPGAGHGGDAVLLLGRCWPTPSRLCWPSHDPEDESSSAPVQDRRHLGGGGIVGRDPGQLLGRGHHEGGGWCRTAAPSFPTPLATSVQTAAGTWATIPMGHLGQPLNTFWQLFFQPPGATSWSNQVEATATATNGGLVLASAGDRSVIVGVRPSVRLHLHTAHRHQQRGPFVVERAHHRRAGGPSRRPGCQHRRPGAGAGRRA